MKPFSSQTSRSNSGKRLDGLSLFVIEDEQDTREIITFILQMEGANVITVIHIYEAINWLRVSCRS
jgi:DNA-binding NtrC family response regulator